MTEEVVPHLVNAEHLSYLDALKVSGLVNMFESPMHLAKEFGVDLRDAKKIVLYWMETFTERHPDEV